MKSTFVTWFNIKFNITPLHIAIDQENLEIVQLLLDQKEIDVNVGLILYIFIFYIISQIKCYSLHLTRLFFFIAFQIIFFFLI